MLGLTPFQQLWAQNAQRLGLRVKMPFAVAIGEQVVEVPVLLEDFGACRGMLLVTDWDTIAPHEAQLVALGFGYSCLSEPLASETDADGLRDMLVDWGWWGDSAPSPTLAAFLAHHEHP